jgi:ketosteroid isomerase-like protein
MSIKESEPPMTSETIAAFAQNWIDAWNRRDLEAVLAHFADDIRFTSPRAQATVGTATVVGKAALRDYWRAALAAIGTLQFTLAHPVWDPERQELALLYTAAIDGRRLRACEFMRFDPAGRIVAAEAMYGAPL